MYRWVLYAEAQELGVVPLDADAPSWRWRAVGMRAFSATTNLVLLYRPA